MILALIVLASGAGNMAGSYWTGQAGNGTVTLALSNESLITGMAVAANAAESDQEQAAAPDQSGYVDEQSAKCLECHGPFEELLAKPGSFVITDYEGEKKINPHRYVPHNTKDVPACINCHVVHPVPPEKTPERPKYIKWCYDVCHHQMNFEKCSTCHEGR